MNAHGQKMKLLNFFSCGYVGDYTSTTLAKQLSFSRPTMSRLLVELEKQNVLRSTKNGSNVLYELANTLESKEQLITAETQKISQLPKHIRQVLYKLVDHVDICIIFGSYSSGLYTKHSDLDIVCINANKKEVQRLLSLLAIDVQDSYITWEEFKTSDKNPLYIELIKNHIIVGNVAKLVVYWCDTLLAKELVGRKIALSQKSGGTTWS
jgi:DNA polymerase sigma